MIGKLLVFVGVALLAVMVALVGNVLHVANVFVTFTPHDDERCTLITASTPNAAGLEDGDIANGVVLFTADGLARRHVLFAKNDADAKAPVPNGALFAYVDGGSLRETKRIREPEPFAFHPHGMSLLGVKSGAAANRARLFVVNHRPEFEEVSVYNYDAESNTAEYIDAIRDKSLLRNINDVTAVSENEVYVTQWHAAETNTFAHTVEVRCARACAKTLTHARARSCSRSDRGRTWCGAPSTRTSAGSVASLPTASSAPTASITRARRTGSLSASAPAGSSRSMRATWPARSRCGTSSTRRQ